MRSRLSRGVALASGLAILVGGCALPTSGGVTIGGTTGPGLPGATGAAGTTPPGPHDHVVVIVMENQDPSGVIGTRAAPWLTAAAQRYGSATEYFAVAHPSQPNYIALTSGSTQGVTGDGPVTIDAPNIVDRLEAAGRSWKAYMQSLPAGGTANKLSSSARSLYARKHDPFVSYVDVASNEARMARIVDLSELGRDADAGTLPDFAWISPDQCHDMHGIGDTGSTPCAFPQDHSSLVRAGDAFLATWVPRILASPGWTDRSVIFITWDESDSDSSGCCGADPGGGRVPLLVVGSGPHRSSATPYDHYSLLATILQRLGLACLARTCDSATVRPISDLLPQP